MRTLRTCLFMIGAAALAFSGCGYTTKTVLPRNIKTIYVETVKNKIPITNLYAYQQGLEMDITNAVIAGFQTDGNLRVAIRDRADAVLQMHLLAYEQEGLRFSQLEEVKEYRIYIVMSLTLVHAKTGEIIWQEPEFSGEASYYVTQLQPIGEQYTAQQAVAKVAKNIVDRVAKDW